MAVLVASFVATARPAQLLIVRAEAGGCQWTRVTPTAGPRRVRTGCTRWKELTTPASYQQKIEFSSPNNVRIETTATDPSGASGRQQLFFDGKAAWIYVPDAKVAQPIDPRMVLSQSPFAPSTLAGAIEGLSQAFNAKQLSDDAVLGRPAYVLELTPKDPAQRGPMAKITTWLDEQTLLHSRRRSRLRGADQRAVRRLGSKWAIAPSDFTFTPSADVRIGQVLPPGAITAMRLELWSQLAAQSGFQLFRPFCGIDGLDEGMPARDQRGVVVLPLTANGSPVVLMQQGPRDAFPTVNGENVTIGDITAIYRATDGVEHLDSSVRGRTSIQAPHRSASIRFYHLACRSCQYDGLGSETHHVVSRTIRHRDGRS